MPLMAAVSHAASARLQEFQMHQLSKMAWSSAVLPYALGSVHPFLTEVLSMVARHLEQMNSPGAHSLLWALWTSGHPKPLDAVFCEWLHKGVDLSDMSTAVDVLLMDSEWRRDEDERMWLSLLKPGSRSGAPQRVIDKWSIAPPSSSEVLGDSSVKVIVADAPWDLSKVERNRPELAKYLQRFPSLEKWVQPTSGNHWDKLSSVIEFVERRLRLHLPTMPAAPLHLLEVLEVFAQSREHWLKVAGGAKGEVVEHTFNSRGPWRPHEVVLECGTFVGYSATRLAVQVWRHCGGPVGPRVATIEVDPIHVCIARHFLDLAGISNIVEVSLGQVRDVVPRIVENFGANTLGFIFMDYKGSIFHADLEWLELLSAIAPRGLEVADNVALPGAPLLLWRLAKSASWLLTAYAMMEFFEPNTEDWMAVGEYQGPCRPTAAAPPAPIGWQRLNWHTDHMRRRAGGLRPTEGDMFEADRVAYSRHVRRHFVAAGIEAIPWKGPPSQDQDELE
eukprot:gnl/TRDRNA2_/TRDRNA2_166191_c1_seq5.p1 gnl/TRDRNA2_/TRDRNA2_166191_c1~~gnl/TRDRNA2_/TRDRNA2_166191_c1_seq5.p1  ORF type:complete len:504 (-),score=79.15 gnl/TRDRNA2_/TRDRNA2_166191_c1_seq5:36-1547(-)